MIILYTLLIIWVVVGLLLYSASMVLFKSDIDTVSSLVKDYDMTIAFIKLSKQYDEMPIIGKVVFFLFMLFASPLLFVMIMFKSKGGGV